MTRQERIEKLRAARQLLAEKFTTGAFARDAKGNKCDPMDPDAVCFCSLGVLYKTCELSYRNRDAGCYDELSQELYATVDHSNDRGASVVGINDYRGKAAALALFDNTITRLEATL